MTVYFGIPIYKYIYYWTFKRNQVIVQTNYKTSIIINFKLFVNWLAWELVSSKFVGVLHIYQAQQGDSMATLWVGTSPASGHQPAPSHGRNLSGETYLTQIIPTMKHFLWGMGWAGHWIPKTGDQRIDPQSSTEQANYKYDEQTSDPSKEVIHKGQQSRQL